MAGDNIATNEMGQGIKWLGIKWVKMKWDKG